MDTACRDGAAARDYDAIIAGVEYQRSSGDIALRRIDEPRRCGRCACQYKVSATFGWIRSGGGGIRGIYKLFAKGLPPALLQRHLSRSDDALNVSAQHGRWPLARSPFALIRRKLDYRVLGFNGAVSTRYCYAAGEVSLARCTRSLC